VQLDDFRSFVIADIPGLIEGAHLGQGLGIQFLRHIERTRLLAHLVDVSESSGRDPAHDFEIIMQELSAFSEDMAAKPMLIVATKIDVAQDPARLDSLKALAAEREMPFFAISSVTGEGLDQLRYAMAERALDPAAHSKPQASARGLPR
jgi:GTP-binding protein